MSQNSDAVKGAYEAFNQGNVDGVAAILADDVSWEGPNTDGVPMSGTNTGKDAVLQALGGIGDDFEKFDVSPDKTVEEGNTVVVLSHIEASTKSGNEVKLPGVEVWEMSDGMAQRVRSLIDTAEMKAALGS